MTTTELATSTHFDAAANPFWEGLRRRGVIFARNRGALLGVGLLLMWILLAVFAEQIAPHDPLMTVDRARQAPSADFWFGTDKLGRDVFSRVLFGARVSLLLGVISVTLGLFIGTLLGMLAGFYGGWVDTIIMRFVDALLAFPGMLLALVVIASLGPSIQNVMLAVGVSTIPQYARLARGSVLSIRQLLYVDSARVIGASTARILFRHILPNAAAPLIVLSTLQVGNAILVGSGLSFLGLGAQPPTPEWGLMTADGRDLIEKAWWVSTFPGLAILSVVMASNLMGDGLRVALDPRMRVN
ncbi:MAG: ABC transporter permease [Caldilineaceae bacterium]|nr:ABC transporter permease [Caldilineaceae bacterium]